MQPMSEFTYRRRVTFPETDATGIVHFSNFFRYIEEAETSMWRAAGLPLVSDGTVWWPRVHAAFDYKRPLRFEDEFDVRVQVVEKTAKALRYAVEMRKGDELIGSGTLTVVCAVKAADGTLKAANMSADVATRLVVATPGPSQ